MVDIETAKRAGEAKLMSIKGVEGVGIGADEIGNPVILVYVSDASAKQRVPLDIGGFPVLIQNLGGPIDAL